MVTNTFAGKTLELVSHILTKKVSDYLWVKLSAEFVAGASSATIFLMDAGIAIDSVFFRYELFVLMEKGIERVIQFV